LFPETLTVNRQHSKKVNDWKCFSIDSKLFLNLRRQWRSWNGPWCSIVQIYFWCQRLLRYIIWVKLILKVRLNSDLKICCVWQLCLCIFGRCILEQHCKHYRIIPWLIVFQITSIVLSEYDLYKSRSSYLFESYSPICWLHFYTFDIGSQHQDCHSLSYEEHILHVQ